MQSDETDHEDVDELDERAQNSSSHENDDRSSEVDADDKFYQRFYPTCGNSESLIQVQCRLEARDLWAKFHELGTEMIITKSGRYCTKKLSRFLFIRLPLRYRTVIRPCVPACRTVTVG